MTRGLNCAPSADDEPDWTFQGLSRQQLETARHNCAGMAEQVGLRQTTAAVVIQAGIRRWLARGSALSYEAVSADVDQHTVQISPTSDGQEPQIEVLSPALRTSPGMRRSISLEPAEGNDETAEGQDL